MLFAAKIVTSGESPQVCVRVATAEANASVDLTIDFEDGSQQMTTPITDIPKLPNLGEVEGGKHATDWPWRFY